MTEETAPTGTPPAHAGDTGATRTFTQADLDRIIAERLTREREKYADYETLKQKSATADNLQTVVQGLRGELTTLRRRQAAFEEALRAGLPVERWEAAYRLLDVEKIAVGEDGAVDGAKDAVAGLLAAYPWLLPPASSAPAPAAPTSNGGSAPMPPPAPALAAGNPGGTAGLTLEALRTMTPEQVAARIDDVQKLLRGSGR